MRNRVHGLHRRQRPFVLELVCLSEITFRRIPAILLSGEKIEAWALWIHQPGDGLATLIHVYDAGRN